MAKKLTPGEHYTFNPRKLCAGRQVKDETDGHLEASLWEYIPYWTPTKAGTYTVEFPPWEEKFSFVIGEENGVELHPTTLEGVHTELTQPAEIGAQ